MARLLRELCAPSPLAIGPVGALSPPEPRQDAPPDAAEDATVPVAEEAALEPVGPTPPPAADFDVVLIDAPDFAQFPEQGALVALSDLVLPVIEADRTRLAEIRSQLDDLAMMHANVPGVLLTKRRQANSSWAFSWLALTQRRAMERAA
jgi:Mrp family chromosome partitioning ATPase